MSGGRDKGVGVSVGNVTDPVGVGGDATTRGLHYVQIRFAFWISLGSLAIIK